MRASCSNRTLQGIDEVRHGVPSPRFTWRRTHFGGLCAVAILYPDTKQRLTFFDRAFDLPELASRLWRVPADERDHAIGTADASPHFAFPLARVRFFN